eukprot:193665_1
MAQTSIYNLGTTGDDSVDELLVSIALNISNLRTILDNVGTTLDTIDKRQEFNTLRKEVNTKISRAIRKLNRSFTEESSDSESSKYQNELQEHSTTLRSILESAVQSFKSYPPYSAVIAEHDEKSPLLSAAHQPRDAQIVISSIAKNVKVVDERQLLEEEEEKMTEIHESIHDMKQVFEQLDTIVNEQKDMVEQLEHNVTVIKHNIGAGKGHLEITQRNQRRSRLNKIVLLVILIIVLAIIIAFVWAYDRTK